MDVSGGNSARGACFLAQILKPLHKSKRKMPNTGSESPEMGRGSRREAFRGSRAMSQHCSCTNFMLPSLKSWSWLPFHITKANHLHFAWTPLPQHRFEVSSSISLPLRSHQPRATATGTRLLHPTCESWGHVLAWGRSLTPLMSKYTLVSSLAMGLLTESVLSPAC